MKRTHITLAAPAIIAALALGAPAVAQASTTCRGGFTVANRDASLSPVLIHGHITAANIAPLRNRQTGRLAGGCWVAEQVAYDGLRYYAGHGTPYSMTRTFRVTPRGATHGETWTYRFTSTLAGASVLARCGHQSVRFNII